MRFIVKKEIDKTDKLKSKSTYIKLQAICRTKNKSLISDRIYRDSYDTKDGRRSFVEDMLAKSYLNKCAYCERICKADIEHYRPKKAVTEVKDHDGYYWLCYEWSNLIPSCITCNRDGSKHNKFPILGSRVKEHSELPNGELDLDKFKAANSPLVKEKPFLLHPEIDIPEDFFEFYFDEEDNGVRIEGIDKDERGAKTIEICKLNRRELTLDRKASVVTDFVGAIKAAFVKYGDPTAEKYDPDKLIDKLEELIEELVDRSNSKEHTYTLLRKFIVKDVTNFKKVMNSELQNLPTNLIYQVADGVFQRSINPY